MSRNQNHILAVHRAGRIVALISSASLLALASAAMAGGASADAAGSGVATEATGDTPNASVSEITVTAAPRQEVKARAVQFEAPNLISVQSADTILKYPDFNAAESLGRMPGISLSSDTGEGRFVQIRGIDANLDGATYGGVPLLNTNPGGTAAGGGGRAVEFDTVPTGAIDGIVVTYTPLPDHEAEGLGGAIELTPRSAANITKPFLDATIGWGYEPLHDHTGPFEGDVAMGVRFGFNENGLLVQNEQDNVGTPKAGFISNPTPFALIISGSRQDDRRAIDDLEESYIDDGLAPSKAVSQYDLRRYNYHRRRFSYGGELDFTPNEDHRWYLRADVAGYTESVHKNFLLFKNLNADENTSGTGPVVPVDPNDPNGFLVTTTPTITETDEEEVHRNQLYDIGGVDRWDNIVLDYHAAYSRATFHVRRNIGAQFADDTAVPITYDNITNPNFPIFTTPGTNLNNPSMYTLNPNSLSNAQDYDVDEEYSGAANLLFPVHLINDSDRVKIGFEVRLRDKNAIEYDENYGAAYNNAPGASAITLAAPGYGGSALTYYDGLYPNGPQVNIYTIRNLINSLSSAPSSAPMFNFNSYLTAQEDIYAGYAQYTTTVGRWGFLAGVRVEDTNATYGGYVFDTNAAGDTTDSLQFRNVDYINAFPTVQLRYQFTPTVVARLTYSSGIARPGFNQNTTAASIDRTQDPVAITRGNPDLKPTLGNNFDFSLEDYLPNGGIIQVALFDKEFTNYIAPRIENGVTNDPLAPGVLANVTTFLNIPSAYARGVTGAYHQKFSWLPKPLDGFGIESNITLVDSHFLEYTAAQSLTHVNEFGQLPGTSQVTWNLAGFYEAHGVETRLAAEYVSHSLFGLGGDQSLDTIQDDRLTMDLSSSYKINKTWTVYFNAKNLLNTPLRYYEGSTDRPIQREFYDITVEGGIRAHF
jgi:TonB-dependent receptor